MARIKTVDQQEDGQGKSVFGHDTSKTHYYKRDRNLDLNDSVSIWEYDIA